MCDVDLITAQHRIFTPNAEFADYLEVDERSKTEYPQLLVQLNACATADRLCLSKTCVESDR